MSDPVSYRPRPAPTPMHTAASAGLRTWASCTSSFLLPHSSAPSSNTETWKEIPNSSLFSSRTTGQGICNAVIVSFLKPAVGVAQTFDVGLNAEDCKQLVEVAASGKMLPSLGYNLCVKC